MKIRALASLHCAKCISVKITRYGWRLAVSGKKKIPSSSPQWGGLLINSQITASGDAEKKMQKISFYPRRWPPVGSHNAERHFKQSGQWPPIILPSTPITSLGEYSLHPFHHHLK
ncbi:hypothetical protein ACL655_16895 [Klebsiella quasipneumoniae subsp. similipneumoniae]